MKFLLQKYCIFGNEEFVSLLQVKYCTSNSPLLSPNGPLSREVPAIAINEASRDIKKVLEGSEGEKLPRNTP